MQVQEKQVFSIPGVLKDRPTHYCPGCHHGTAHRIVAECLTEMGLVEKTICAASVGCSVLIYNYFDLDIVESPHGRAPAVATGIKRSRPDAFVFTYQGDGDLASIGIAEIMHCANRGERVSVIFVNNTVYGMTGGQMAPTTLIGQKTTTCPGGRCLEREGAPMKMAELIGSLGGTVFSARVALNNIKNLKNAKKAVLKAFEVQERGLGFSFVEILATCPTNWRMTPIQANERVAKEMIPCFPLGVFKDTTKKQEKP